MQYRSRISSFHLCLSVIHQYLCGSRSQFSCFPWPSMSDCLGERHPWMMSGQVVFFKHSKSFLVLWYHLLSTHSSIFLNTPPALYTLSSPGYKLQLNSPPHHPSATLPLPIQRFKRVLNLGSSCSEPQSG